jgi:hypothetical protein
MQTYTINVTHNGRDISADLAKHPAIDGWTPGEDSERNQPHAAENRAIGTLAGLTASEASICLSQIIDMGREHGPTDDLADHLHAMVEPIVAQGEGYLATPDGYLIHITSDSTVSYREAMQTFRDLLEQENLDEGLNNEYVRGGVNLLADCFGKFEMDVSTRMEQVLHELRNMDIS